MEGLSREVALCHHTQGRLQGLHGHRSPGRGAAVMVGGVGRCGLMGFGAIDLAGGLRERKLSRKVFSFLA